MYWEEEPRKKIDALESPDAYDVVEDNVSFAEEELGS